MRESVELIIHIAVHRRIVSSYGINFSEKFSPGKCESPTFINKIARDKMEDGLSAFFLPFSMKSRSKKVLIKSI